MYKLIALVPSPLHRFYAEITPKLPKSWRIWAWISRLLH